MYYYFKNSSKKIIHSAECFHITHTDSDRVGCFESLTKAYEQGYRLCKHCSPLARHYKKECDEIFEFCRLNGFSVHLGNRSVSVCSTRSKWKIIPDESNNISLYHKNSFTTEKDAFSEINGYHLQGDVRKNSIIAYLEYIIDHDRFRMLNPVYVPKSKKDLSPPRKGTKKYKKNQLKVQKYERKKAIRNVLELIDSLNISSSVA